jgi:hypothetical protein
MEKHTHHSPEKCFPINIIHDIKKKEIAKQKNKQITTEEKQIKHKQDKNG